MADTNETTRKRPGSVSVQPNSQPWPYPVTFGTIRFFLLIGAALGFLAGACGVATVWLMVSA